MVVDDEQLAREELCFLLGQIGAIEVVARPPNGLEALRVIEEQRPDLVMLDVQMPGPDRLRGGAAAAPRQAATRRSCS